MAQQEGRRKQTNICLQERFELLVEPAEDTKVLVCWNRDSVILTFRGTASMTNVLADLQVCPSANVCRPSRANQSDFRAPRFPCEGHVDSLAGLERIAVIWKFYSQLGGISCPTFSPYQARNMTAIVLY